MRRDVSAKWVEGTAPDGSCFPSLITRKNKKGRLRRTALFLGNKRFRSFFDLTIVSIHSPEGLTVLERTNPFSHILRQPARKNGMTTFSVFFHFLLALL
ncbi:hypothetical protein HMPREF1326_01810 [Akkermansia sp. KLE1605]|nr:hypothetical protein HMPREF1326_01810 [Akkermansia sp. KLE1605]